MKRIYLHMLTCCIALLYGVVSFGQKLDSIDFLQRPFVFDHSALMTIEVPQVVDIDVVHNFYEKINNSTYQALVDRLEQYRHEEQLSDWLYYQLVRHVSEIISPKHVNYHRYTLYKWFLMNKSGYDARVAVGNEQIIFYIRNQEDIRDIPYFEIDNKKYTCLNVHDYGKLFKNEGAYEPVDIFFPESQKDFSYKITAMPELNAKAYMDKKIDFKYQNKVYNFNIKVNEEVSSIFANYPGVDFESYFNIPLTQVTYKSLIPILKDNIKDLSTQNGVDYLMRFTRYAFLYEDDDANFGKEKRLSPGQTLMTEFSDCDDRAALFFYLVKEIYNLPMVAILYPTHITMGVQFEQKLGATIQYEGQYFSICEPTPQRQNLSIGEVADRYKEESYKVVYHYQPNL